MASIPGLATPKLSDILKQKEQIQARVVDIIDGDTIQLVFPFPGSDVYIRMNTRVYGIDTCEKTGPNSDLANKAINYCEYFFTSYHFLERKTLQRFLDEHEIIVFIELLGLDKYGRLLANIYKDGNDYGKCIKNECLATSYYGKTKMTTLEQQAALTSNK
jgi:endonuclease YncB( thermonuclease family)